MEGCPKRTLHSGTKETSRHLRTQFGYPGGRIFTQKVPRNCNTCRRIDSKSYRYPDQPALPSYRINSAPPFSAVGIDYTGHFFVEFNTAEQSEAYITVFACCITRGVYLHFVTDLTAEHFLLVFLPFFAGKSVPTTVVSDNVTYCLAGDSAIKTILEDDTIQQHFTKHQIKWIHIPGNITSVGRIVRKTCRFCQKLTEEKCQKGFTDTKRTPHDPEEKRHTVNNRPLTYVESNTTQHLNHQQHWHRHISSMDESYRHYTNLKKLKTTLSRKTSHT